MLDHFIGTLNSVILFEISTVILSRGKLQAQIKFCYSIIKGLKSLCSLGFLLQQNVCYLQFWPNRVPRDPENEVGSCLITVPLLFTIEIFHSWDKLPKFFVKVPINSRSITCSLKLILIYIFSCIP